nr:diguanylate cyclase [Gammaproteobacteria bacterium]
MTVHYLHPEFSKSRTDVRLGVTSHESLKQQRMEHQLRVLELTDMLHRKLDLMLLLECFFIESQSFIKYDGLQYQQPDRVPPTLMGSRRQHVIRFELALGDESLGEVTFYRARRFSPREDREFERLIAHICYPLSNALDYQAAIQATLVDDLTGLNNRLAFDQSLPREIVLAQRNETPMSLLLLDVDHFQQIKDTHGDAVGDDILTAV